MLILQKQAPRNSSSYLMPHPLRPFKAPCTETASSQAATDVKPETGPVHRTYQLAGGAAAGSEGGEAQPAPVGERIVGFTCGTCSTEDKLSECHAFLCSKLVSHLLF